MTAAPKTERHESLDVLRGVAILGIFPVNIIGFAFPWTVLSNPSVFPEAYAAGAFWWQTSFALFQFKFISLFSMMFGAGIALMLGMDANADKKALHRRRMFWLFIIGMLHNYLIWYGDILAPYAVAGLLVAGARHWGGVRLLVVATILIGFNFALFILQDIGFQSLPADELAEISIDTWAPTPEKLEEYLAAYRSGFFERLPYTAENALLAQMVQGIFLAPRTIGLMMIGMALFKTGFLTLRWRASLYAAFGLVFTAAGLAGSLWSARHGDAVGYDLLKVFPGQAVLYWASLVQAFGYACLVMLICKVASLAVIRAPFAAAGRMALTNYLACSIIGITIFYGPPGAGFIGQMAYADLALIVTAVWVAILVWSPLWLAAFRFGPAEWLWRSLTYGRAQPLMKR